jgi:hypothetical protein
MRWPLRIACCGQPDCQYAHAAPYGDPNPGICPAHGCNLAWVLVVPMEPVGRVSTGTVTGAPAPGSTTT